MPTRFREKARELEEVFSEGPGSFSRLEHLRTAFVKEVNAFYLYERNKIDGDVPAATRKRKERASASASSPRVPRAPAFESKALNDRFDQLERKIMNRFDELEERLLAALRPQAESNSRGAGVPGGFTSVN